MHALVVDDSKPVRSILTKVLGELQFQCHEAANGVEALDKLVRMPRPTLITLNRHMPEMDGFEFLTRLRKLPGCESIPVVIVSALDVTPAQRAQKNGGIVDIISKSPSTARDVATYLRERLQLAPQPPVTR